MAFKLCTQQNAGGKSQGGKQLKFGRFSVTVGNAWNNFDKGLKRTLLKIYEVVYSTSSRFIHFMNWKYVVLASFTILESDSVGKK